MVAAFGKMVSYKYSFLSFFLSLSLSFSLSLSLSLLDLCVYITSILYFLYSHLNSCSFTSLVNLSNYFMLPRSVLINLVPNIYHSLYKERMAQAPVDVCVCVCVCPFCFSILYLCIHALSYHIPPTIWMHLDIQINDFANPSLPEDRRARLLRWIR